MKHVGFVGLGIMGRPMARNLAKADVKLMVNDLNREAVADLEKMGAEFAEPAEIGSKCEIIFTILPTGNIVKDVVFGKEGLGLQKGRKQILCDMSSVTPAESRYCWEQLRLLEIDFVDAPVSGGEPKAIDGTLAFMAGGEAHAFEALKPYFEIMGDSAILVGGPGCGSIAKLTNQAIVNMTIAAVGEAFVLAAKSGADPAKVYEAIRGGLAGSVVLDAKVPMMLNRDFKPGGKISINHKDIKNVMESARERNVPMPLTAQLFQIMQWMEVHGHMDEDHAALVKYFESLADIEVK